jgi:hypothetical protein
VDTSSFFRDEDYRRTFATFIEVENPPFYFQYTVGTGFGPFFKSHTASRTPTDDLTRTVVEFVHEDTFLYSATAAQPFDSGAILEVVTTRLLDELY